MKKIGWIFIVLFLLVIPPAISQIRLGIQGGANIATVSFGKDVLDADNVTGFQIGPVLELMSPVGLGADIALLYTQKGFEHKDEGIVNDFLEVPLNLKWKFKHFPLVKPYIAAGPYVSLRIGGDKNWTVAYEDVTDQIRSKSFAAGVNLGAGVELLNHLRVGLTHSWGVTDNYSVDKGDLTDVIVGKGKNRTWSITAAILF